MAMGPASCAWVIARAATSGAMTKSKTHASPRLPATMVTR